ncbi:enoyl-CoA hydratase/isomerase family protein [Aeromicrobium senzhongii]|uniref:Enoyl-CoA hydratase/isomerase family protein n=1 Tax=Aeromicrobium senzhongii TaxID=2663859 RepID=A0ABX6SU20_9ACTN|nr:enoyl-CoA hydratase-related protein [Aeromicrobium senzhongii]MTB88099.1 enoyl-CoA hydratase [Aeromicrobium senzhongii]QNL94904.1 enoyl-CoA hydratase/isomerase family protein [Aeromicrobium senzhongii]
MSEEQDVIVLTRDRPGTGTITLNRPHRRNAWTVPLQRAYFGALEELTADPDVRAIVVTGAGGTFCPGADTQALQVYSDTATTNPEMATIEQPEWFTLTVPKPVIAAISGMCAGVGLAQALMCDLRITAPDTRFTTAFARRALPPMHGMGPLLARAAGESVAADLLLTARTFDGVEAHRLGVVNEISDAPLERALDLAAELAATCAPSSLATIKAHLVAPWLDRVRDATESADATLDDVLGSADFREGLASLLERRPPRFPPLSRDQIPHPQEK